MYSYPDLVQTTDFRYLKLFILHQLEHHAIRHLSNRDLRRAFEKFCCDTGNTHLLQESSLIYNLVKQTTELILTDKITLLSHRYSIMRYRFYKIGFRKEIVTEIAVKEFLDLCDRSIRPEEAEKKLELNFIPYYSNSRNIQESEQIGKGIDYLSEYLSGHIARDRRKWQTHLVSFLQNKSKKGQWLLFPEKRPTSAKNLIDNLTGIIVELKACDPDTDNSSLADLLKKRGLGPGWGNNAGNILETISLLLELLQTPDNRKLINFISRLPLTLNIALISPHGWFGQDNVLGRPDTGGQIVYILDQTRALEKALLKRIQRAGLQLKPSIVVVTRLIPENDGTSSNVPLEKIHNTNNSHILRIPFNDSSGRVVSHWISRFKIWPYLERFALTAERELSNHFGEKPDLIMGNYSDGNLVAAIMAHDLDTTHGAIAHALEKTKYPYSDLYWAKYEDDYHFSLQFTADLIAMNSADFILTSTFQEIGGSADFVGQYESYQYFTMPGLMQVNCGINLYQPKFNVVPPGVDDRIYFSNTNKAKRRPDKTSSLKQLLFCQKNEYIYGELGDKVKIPLLTLARLDKTKNISGLVESFGRSTELQERCNLIIIAGKIKSDLASDDEEKDEIKRMYELIAKYKLKDKIRWLGMHLPKEDTGEVYRIIADHKGFFIQPAIFEGFGLTVLEAMASGLPTFATQYGGPSEIIINEKTGFLINPATAELISEPILNFLQKTDNDPREWNRISDGGLKRVRDNFTWDIYSNKLLDIAALYGFWRHISTREDNRGLTGYCQLLFHLFFKPRAKKLEKNTTLSFRLSGTAGTVPV